MSCKNTALAADTARAARNSNGCSANTHYTRNALENEAIPRLHALVTNAAASLLGDLEPEAALIATVKLGDAALRWIAVDRGEREQMYAELAAMGFGESSVSPHSPPRTEPTRSTSK